MTSAYDDACEYAAECGVPDEYIDEVVEKSELCCDGPYGDGPCADNTKALIEREAKRFITFTDGAGALVDRGIIQGEFK